MKLAFKPLFFLVCFLTTTPASAQIRIGPEDFERFYPSDLAGLRSVYNENFLLRSRKSRGACIGQYSERYVQIVNDPDKTPAALGATTRTLQSQSRFEETFRSQLSALNVFEVQRQRTTTSEGEAPQHEDSRFRIELLDDRRLRASEPTGGVSEITRWESGQLVTELQIGRNRFVQVESFRVSIGYTPYEARTEIFLKNGSQTLTTADAVILCRIEVIRWL